MNKNTNINVRLTDTVKMNIKEKADAKGLSLSAYILQLHEEQKIKSIIKNLEQTNNILGMIKLKANDNEMDIDYALNLSSGLLETIQNLYPKNKVLTQIRKNK